MQITAALVKELRERTGAGMMECKKALVENDGNIEAAIEAMRKSGQAKAAKKAGRLASEGLIVIKQHDRQAAMAEINCETDFVAKGDDFKNFCQHVVATVLATRPANLEQLLATPLDSGSNVEETRLALIAKISENMTVRRFTWLEVATGNHLGVYLHGTRIGVFVEMRGGSPELAKDMAMHVAANRPWYVAAEQVPADLIAKEREIYLAQAAETEKGKSAEIREKIVNGKIQKFLKDNTLLGQLFLKDDKQTVEKVLKSHRAEVIRFERFEVAEGIEKNSTCSA